LNADTRHQLCLELRHLQSQLSATALGEALSFLERAWALGREAAMRTGFVLRLGAEAVREDLRRISGSFRR
jgi:hypothetical protein